MHEKQHFVKARQNMKNRAKIAVKLRRKQRKFVSR